MIVDVAGILESCHTFREHETWSNILDEVGTFTFMMQCPHQSGAGDWHSGVPYVTSK